MPAAIKLKEEYGDALEVLFVESQNTSEVDTARFILEHRWMGAKTKWTNEHPFTTGSRGLPNFVVLSSTGEVLAKGSGVLTSRDKDLIADEIKAAKALPATFDKAFKKAWSDFHKGKIASAIEKAREVGIKHEELVEQAMTIVADFESRVQSRFDSIRWSMENGHALEAQSKLEGLMKELKDAEKLLASAQEIERSFESDAMKLELEADAALSRALEKLFEDGRDDKLFEKVDKLADKYDGTKASVRARRIVAMGT